ncbi:hypothetical protein [Ornithinimicrobium kibberense]|uniref:hypothetical protein n=1 Tax=Ornithinimicrobium kibberense TaxID=282060 RepID=UPI00360BFBAE
MSSTSWTKTWREDRLTTRRGRSAVPVTRLRRRTWRRLRAASLVLERLTICAMAYLPAFPTLRRMCSPS